MAPHSIAITPVKVADLLAEGQPMPVCVHVIDHPNGRVLVDTSMTELHPAVADRAVASPIGLPNMSTSASRMLAFDVIDETAIRVVDGNVDVVSGGTWKLLGS